MMPPKENPVLARIDPESTQGELAYLSFHQIRNVSFISAKYGYQTQTFIDHLLAEAGA